jgi:hypothetical protein
MKVFAIIASILLLIITIPLTLLGVVPVLSSLIGASQVDLGISVTPQETQEAIAKVGTNIITLPSDTALDAGFRLEGSKDASFTMTSQELSAHSNNRPWANYPVRNVQIKIADDGQIEASAILIISKAMPYALNLGYSEAQIRDAMSEYNLPSFEVPIYIRGFGEVIEDKSTVNAQEVKIGAIIIPTHIVNQANTEVKQVIDDLISKHSHSFHAQYLKFKDGQMQFQGTVAENQYVVGTTPEE